jgi:hypothetical protein
MFLILTHITACVWLIIPTFVNDNENDLSNTWLIDYKDLTDL